MKQVTYEIRGLVIETMIPAITASCESLDHVKNVRITVSDNETARLILVIDEESSEQWESAKPLLEKDLSVIMDAKGLILVTPPVAEAAVGESQRETPALDPRVLQGRTAPVVLPKRERKVSLVSAVSAVIVAVVLTVLCTAAMVTMFSDNGAAVNPGQQTSEGASLEQLDVIDRLFRSVTVLDLDDDALVTAVLKAYVAATGDKYAEYFTAEEYAEQNSTQNGEMCGIGISVVNGLVTVGGVEYQVITVASVYPDSPAEAAGLLPGDHIMYVGGGETKTLVHDIGYTEALTRLKGEEGTACTFTVYNPDREGDGYAEITAVREKMTTLSVMGRVHAEDPTVGIVKITGFDNTTRDQFVETVESLKNQGCEYFVLDLRGNPGGLLTSVEDVLVFFLQEGDTVISIKNAAGQESKDVISVNSQGQVLCGSRELKAEDVGKYRDLKFSVLVNEYSASAAELFTANVRDYELGSVVGVKTYGKGSMQTTYSLDRYGYDGALKLTSAYYYPPCGVGYDGIGIVPDVTVELSEEAKAYNINLLPDGLDNQLAAAVAEAKK